MKREALLAAIVAAFALGPSVTAAAGVAAPAARGLAFEQVFSVRNEPSALHYQVSYGAPGSKHKLEVWRDGQQRLVRRTDEAIETHVAREPGAAGFQMVVLDLRRKIETRITRDDLYRIGHFTDWFDLAHGLRYPKAGYTLLASAAPADAPLPVAACNWYLLTQGSRGTRLCWSTAVRLPVLILDERGKVQWQVTAVDRKPPPAAVFEVRDLGYVRTDAGQDISND